MRVTAAILLLVGFATAIRFQIPANGKRCVRDEIHKGIVVTGEYEFSEGINYAGSVHVTDTRGHTLYNRENFQDLKGKFAFTTDDYDVFEFCVSNHAPTPQGGSAREVTLSMKSGVEAKNYDDLAKSMHLKPMEIELKRLEEMSNEIVESFTYMRKREEEMRNTNESTNSRVLYLSIFSMVCLLGLGAWQVMFFRNYFKTKKLID